MLPRSGRSARKAGDIACIYVHAGAGYHSKENESHHLQACNDACQAAMALLRSGGSAIDAIELAIKSLEDREITNAGFGSNLAEDGAVECDAIVVDHRGRSGAAGAVAQIKNPISLARLLLDHSTQSMTLRRVPPNLLVGPGATEFAYEHGIRPVPHDCLISPFAQNRWQKWRADLNKAERHRRRDDYRSHGSSSEFSQPPYIDEHEELERQRTAHCKRMMQNAMDSAAKAAREGREPLSPPPSDIREHETDSSSSQRRSASTVSAAARSTNYTGHTTPDYESDPHPDVYTDPHVPDMANHPFANSSSQLAPSSACNLTSSFHYGDHAYNEGDEVDQLPIPGKQPEDQPVFARVIPDFDSASSGSETDEIQKPSHLASHASQPASPLPANARLSPETLRDPSANTFPCNVQDKDDDIITDTVGAIAVDIYGNMACGASSGGIGMKHRGRIGPAALLGVGATVIPADECDEDQTTVATVTSGTGEHMTTAMASSVCSDRIYRQEAKRPGGGYDVGVTEDQALQAFISQDFMNHPSVKNSTNKGTIGVMSVKKDRDGVWLFFGHNTDSFALASMHSDESVPVCTMSRSKGDSSIAQGGRGTRWRRRK